MKSPHRLVVTAALLLARFSLPNLEAANSMPESAILQPSQTVAVGSNVTFVGKATGVPTPLVQWKKDGAILPGRTTIPLVLTNVQLADSGKYTLVASNVVGTFTSAESVLIVTGPWSVPVVEIQSPAQTATVGDFVSFVGAVSGVPDPTLQWRKGGQSLPGQTGNFLNLSNVQLTDAGTYTLVATNSAGSATSIECALAVNPGPAAPEVVIQVSTQTVTVGENASFAGFASGRPDPTLQWRKNGNDLRGETGSILNLTNVKLTDAGKYHLVATNSVGSTVSIDCVLTVNPRMAGPGGIVQPPGQTPIPVTVVNQRTPPVLRGGNVTFTAGASGSPSPEYQWMRNGVKMPGETNPTLTLTNVQPSAGATYTLVATTKFDLEVYYPVSIASSGPGLGLGGGNSASVRVGDNVEITIRAEGYPAPKIQWKKNGVIQPGRTSNRLSIGRVTLNDAGTYQCVVSNSFSTATSPEFKVQVTP